MFNDIDEFVQKMRSNLQHQQAENNFNDVSPHHVVICFTMLTTDNFQMSRDYISSTATLDADWQGASVSAV